MTRGEMWTLPEVFPPFVFFQDAIELELMSYSLIFNRTECPYKMQFPENFLHQLCHKAPQGWCVKKAVLSL